MTKKDIFLARCKIYVYKREFVNSVEYTYRRCDSKDSKVIK